MKKVKKLINNAMIPIIGIFAVCVAIKSIHGFVQYHNPSQFHNEQWNITSIETCNRESTSPYCVVDVENPRTGATLSATRVNFIVESDDHVFRNCYIVSGKRQCIKGFSQSVPSQFAAPYTEIKQ